MRFSFSQVLALLLVLCSAVALLHVSIALGSSSQFGDSPRTTQVVRTYYASVNGFLAGGDAEGSMSFAVDGADTAEDVVMTSGAFRATYPNVRFHPGEVSEAGDLVLSQVAATDGEANLPIWINDGVGQPFPDSIDSLRIENGEVVERLSSARIGVLAQPLAGNGVDFRIDQASRLKIVEFVLSAPSSRSAFVAISGPGFVLPLDGAFEVAGNGVLQVSNQRDGTTRVLPSDQKAVFSGEEILVIPQGQAVLWSTGHSQVRLMLLAMVPTDPWAQHVERYIEPKGPETFEHLLDRLTVDDALQSTWFGSIQALAVAPIELQAGWLSMDMTRIFVPAGEHVRLSSQGHQLIAVVRAEDTWNELDAFELTNASGSTQILEAVRACWRGAENMWQSECVQPAV